jgi:hypothetical protein
VQQTARIEDFQVTGDHRLLLSFAPSLSAELEFTPDVLKGAPGALAEQSYFALVQIDSLGQLVWPNGYTLNYDTIYELAMKGGGGPPAPPRAESQSSGITIPALLGTLLSGIGVLSFVTLAGGVILWSRFNGMGIPADHALGLVPKSELLATGADFLVPALLYSTAAALIVMGVSSLISRFTKWPYTPLVVSLVVLFVAAVVALLKLGDKLPGDAVWLLVLVAVLGALTVASTARLHPAVFALAMFLAIGSFAIARTYELTSHDLKVLPMAYSRTQPGEATRVETGYFVSETSDRILFASLPEPKRGTSPIPNELREFPREETDDLEIGDLASPQAAEQIAERFAYNLCERLAHLTPAPPSKASAAKGKSKAVAPATKPTEICRRPYLHQLADKAGIEWKPNRAEKLEKGLRECQAHKGHHARALCEKRMQALYGTKRHKGKRA